MSTNRGIFESFPNQPAARQDSPFAVVHEPVETPTAASPFSVAARQDSPFTVVDEHNEVRTLEPGRPVRLPDRRRTESPFQVAEPTEGYGFEAAPPKAYAASPFEIAPAAAPPAPSPFSAPPQQAPASPFSIEPQRAAQPAPQPAYAAWQEPAAQPVFAQAVAPAFAQAPPVAVPSAFAPAPQQAPAPAAPEEYLSDSFSIRQLELRAIFGVDREMNPEEILQRSKALPGMRNISRVTPQDMTTIEALKHLLPNLGFGSGGLKLYSGSTPLEFVREGNVMLAMQTDGGFAPGVRETLMLVARELGRLA